MKPPGPPFDDWLAHLSEVREFGDRRAALPLLEALLTAPLSTARKEEVATVLAQLEDPRCAAPLERLVLDRGALPTARRRALRVLGSLPRDPPDPAVVAAWIADPDPCVRALGLRHVDVPLGDRAAAALTDADPEVRVAATEALVSITRTPGLVAAVRRAFRDPDERVREAACRVAQFDEPLPLTWDLIRAVGDPVGVVRWAAYDALEDYPSVAVLLALADARAGGPEPLVAQGALDHVAAEFLSAAGDPDPRVRERLAKWAAPARWILEEQAERGDRMEISDALEALEPDTPGPRRPRVVLHDAREALAGEWATPAMQRTYLFEHSWRFSGEQGRMLATACASSSNWVLRQGAAYALADLRAVDELLVLARDPEPVVRRSALHKLRELGEPRAIEAAREAMADPWVRPTAGDAAMSLLCALGDPHEVDDLLVHEICRPDDRDGLFLGAIRAVHARGLRSAVPALLAQVNAHVSAGVGPHVAALAALRDLGHPRSRIHLSHLEHIDHLDLQCELARWGRSDATS